VTVLWFAGAPWDGIPGTDRRLATALSARRPVLWVDPPVSPVTTADRRAGAGRLPVPRLSDVDSGITRVTTVALPGLTRPGVRATTAPLLRAQARWALRRLGVRPTAVVATYLDDVLARWDAPGLLYGTDDYVAGAELMGLSAERLRAQERSALRRADVVAAVTPQLANRWTALGARVEVLPNGCLPVDPAPPALTDLAGPVVGVVGQLSDRIDLALLEAVADTGLTLLLVGPHDERFEPGRFAALAARPNVRHVGRVSAAALPGYLATIDVGLTPYRDSAFNRASFPLKTLEYLAAGIPAVSTALPAARWLRDDLRRTGEPRPDDLIAVATGPAGVVAAAGRLAAAPSVAGRCRAFAARHTWDRRAEALVGLIDAPLSRTTRHVLEVR
jgi:teichuronic acid biosynthesis glycosyltransferase TuaH